MGGGQRGIDLGWFGWLRERERERVGICYFYWVVYIILICCVVK